MKLREAVHKKWLRIVLIIIMILFSIGCVWKGIRKTGSIPCRIIPNSQTITYSENDRVLNAIACAEFVLTPRLSCQEKHAFELYESVLSSEEVEYQSYQVMLTGHSLGGSFATMVACASGCNAVTINGADGIAIDKYRGIEGNSYQENCISNHMTSPINGRFSMLDLVQRLMFFGDYQAVDYHVYPENGYTTDTHCAFSFIEFEDAELKSPKIP